MVATVRACPQCALYRAQIVLLKVQIERLKQQINKLIRLIREIETYTFEVYKESDPIVKKGGYAPEYYIWHKSRWIIAIKILKIIRS